jgi:ssRNA-specific RNase YbeY (16S rRNA maturation enzyme)
MQKWNRTKRGTDKKTPILSLYKNENENLKTGTEKNLKNIMSLCKNEKKSKSGTVRKKTQWLCQYNEQQMTENNMMTIDDMT